MAFGLSDNGELALLRVYINNETLELGIYNDSTDNLSDSDTLADVTTEPSGSNYSRQTVNSTNTTVQQDGSKGELKVDSVSFNVSNSSQDVDAWFLYEPNQDNIVWRGEIDTSNRQKDHINLDQISNLNLGGESLFLE